MLCSLEGGAGCHTTTRDVLPITAPWSVSEVVSCRGSVPVALPHLDPRSQSRQPRSLLGTLGVHPAGVGGTSFIMASVLSRDAPWLQIRSSLGVDSLQDYLQGHDESHIVGVCNFAGR